MRKRSDEPASLIRNALKQGVRLAASFLQPQEPYTAALAALDALLAVGERDKAEIAELKDGAWQELCVRADAYLAACAERERDRRQIAQLTEALERIVRSPFSVPGAGLTPREIARAVLADKEDADNG